MHFLGLLAKVFYVQRWNKTLESLTDLKMQIFFLCLQKMYFFSSWLWREEVSPAVIHWNIWFVHLTCWHYPPGLCNSRDTSVSQCPTFDGKVKSSAVYRWATACCKTLTLREWSLIKESTSSTPTAKPTTTPFPSLCLLLHPCSLPWLHLIEIPVLRPPVCAAPHKGGEIVAKRED